MNQGYETARSLFFWPLGVVCIIILLSGQAFSQVTPVAPAARPQPTPRITTEKNFFSNLLKDQKGIWTAPFHWGQNDAKWIAPLGLSMAALIATDRHTSGELVENGDNRERLRISKDISYAGSLYSTGGISAIFYFTGRIRHDERAKETGLLAAAPLIHIP